MEMKLETNDLAAIITLNQGNVLMIGEQYGHYFQSDIQGHFRRLFEPAFPAATPSEDGTQIIYNGMIRGKERAGAKSTKQARFAWISSKALKALEEAHLKIEAGKNNRDLGHKLNEAYRCFALPDPSRDPQLYRSYGIPFAKELLILWGVESTSKTSLPVQKAVEEIRKIRSRERKAIAKRSCIALIICAALLVAILHYADHSTPIAKAGDQNNATQNGNSSTVTNATGPGGTNQDSKKVSRENSPDDSATDDGKTNGAFAGKHSIDAEPTGSEKLPSEQQSQPGTKTAPDKTAGQKSSDGTGVRAIKTDPSGEDQPTGENRKTPVPGQPSPKNGDGSPTSPSDPRETGPSVSPSARPSERPPAPGQTPDPVLDDRSNKKPSSDQIRKEPIGDSPFTPNQPGPQSGGSKGANRAPTDRSGAGQKDADEERQAEPTGKHPDPSTPQTNTPIGQNPSPTSSNSQKSSGTEDGKTATGTPNRPKENQEVEGKPGNERRRNTDDSTRPSQRQTGLDGEDQKAGDTHTQDPKGDEKQGTNSEIPSNKKGQGSQPTGQTSPKRTLNEGTANRPIESEQAKEASQKDNNPGQESTGAERSRPGDATTARPSNSPKKTLPDTSIAQMKKGSLSILRGAQESPVVSPKDEVEVFLMVVISGSPNQSIDPKSVEWKIGGKPVVKNADPTFTTWLKQGAYDIVVTAQSNGQVFEGSAQIIVKITPKTQSTGEYEIHNISKTR